MQTLTSAAYLKERNMAIKVLEDEVRSMRHLIRALRETNRPSDYPFAEIAEGVNATKAELRYVMGLTTSRFVNAAIADHSEIGKAEAQRPSEEDVNGV